jgi:acetyltransferase
LVKLDAVLPAHWSHHNPIDILGDAGHDRYAQALEIAANDPATDALLVALAPQAMTDPTAVARAVAEFAHSQAKPVLASWMGGVAVAEGEALLQAAGIPTYRYPDSAARVFQSMWRHSANLRMLEDQLEAPVASDTHPIIAAARAAGRTLLTEAESKQLLAAFDIPTVPTKIAATANDAVAAAKTYGYPVVVKLHSETITHKTDVGGVRLNLTDEAAVRSAYDAIRNAVPGSDFLGVTVQPMIRIEGYELILGASADPQFGPVLLFGGGGVLVEVYKDRAIGLPPLTASQARRMIEHTKIAQALRGIRGRAPVDMPVLEQILVRFSRLVVEQPWIKELDINPLLASPGQLIALDARVILYPAAAPKPLRPALLA